MIEQCSNNKVVNKCCIIGLGLLGGSLGLALGENRLTGERWGIDYNSLTEKEAIKIGAIDCSGSLQDAVEGADLVIMSVPVGDMPELLKSIEPFLGENTIVTDTGSTKRNVIDAMAKVKNSCKPIGGHPMVGSEKSGIKSARANLFSGATYFLVPVGKRNKREVMIMEKIVMSLGAYPVKIEAKEHDRVMAPLSHLPHLVALGLVSVLQKYALRMEDIEKYVGKGFIDTTRIAAGNSFLWHDIFNDNKDNLIEAVSFLLQELDTMLNCLNKSERQALLKLMDENSAYRRSISEMFN